MRRGNRSSQLRNSKRVEVLVQQYLWPGTKFAGNAKRPALEQCDLRGEDRDGNAIWGEVKNLSPATVAARGLWAVLLDAYEQCQAAIENNQQDWPEDAPIVNQFGVSKGRQHRPRAFSVLWPVGSRREDARLVMYEAPVVGLAVVPLAEFRRQVIGETAGAGSAAPKEG